MIDLYERFGLTNDLDEEIIRFRTKFSNLMADSKFGSDLLDDADDNIPWRFANKYGQRYRDLYGTGAKAGFIFPHSRPFNELLLRIQIVLDLIWESRPAVAHQLAVFIESYFEQSTFNLGYFVKIFKTKSPQILPAKNRTVEKKIIGALDALETKPQKFMAVMEHYDSGIKELLSAKTKPQLKDVVEDMSTVCDSLIKTLFNDENLGFKHLFKEDRWKTLKLNDTEKRMFNDLNNLIDQIKHDVIKNYTKDNVETIVYLVSTLIERTAK